MQKQKQQKHDILTNVWKTKKKETTACASPKNKKEGSASRDWNFILNTPKSLL